MDKHYRGLLSARTSCGTPTVNAVIPGYNPAGPRVELAETTTVRVDVTCPDCKKKMGGVNVAKIKLTPAATGVMIWLAGRWRESNRYPKAKTSTYDSLERCGLTEPSDIAPWVKLTQDGRHWLHANHPGTTA